MSQNTEYTVDPSRLVSPTPPRPMPPRKSACAPKRWMIISVRKRPKKQSAHLPARRPAARGNRWTIFCCTARRALAKQRWPALWRRRWVCRSALPPARPSKKPGDLAALLTNLQEGDILFIDEIHRLSRQVEEVLYPALEDYALDIMIGKGPSAQKHPHQPAAVHPGGCNHPRGPADRAPCVTALAFCSAGTLQPG